MSFQYLKGHVRSATQTCHCSLAPVWCPFRTWVAIHIHWFLLSSPSPDWPQPGLWPSLSTGELALFQPWIRADQWACRPSCKAPIPVNKAQNRASRYIIELMLIHSEQSLNQMQARLTANHLLAHISPADPQGKKGGFSNVVLKTRYTMSISYPIPWR